MRYIGLDLHKQSLEVCALDGKGKRLFRLSVACDRTALGEFARKHLRKTDKLAVEATTNTWAVVEILRPFVAAVVLGKPETVRAKLNEVRRKAGEEPAKKKSGKGAVPEPDAGRLNATYRRSGLPVAKTPDEWSAGERRALDEAGAAAFTREVHTTPVKRPRSRPKAKTTS